MGRKKVEYAVYKGEELLVMGTAQECANELNVTKGYIQWLVTPSAKKELAKRKKPNICRVGVRI